jgi:glycyl-tRNA synthetase beta chain
MKNILVQADASGITEQRVEIPTQTSMHSAQRELTSAAARVTETFWQLCERREYVPALKLLATVRPEVDAFMDPATGVRIMDDDPVVRESRLNLVRDLVKNFSKIADFSEIVVGG